MKIGILSDAPAPTGFGRISNAIADWLHNHGHQVAVFSLFYDGLMPHNKPYHVAAMAGKDMWNTLAGLVPQFGFDCFIACQDFPYAETLYRSTRIDWSRLPLLNITPIDGTPIRTNWLELTDDVDGTMVISRFGVEAMRKAGRRVGLCHPGVDAGYFKPATADERKALREKAGIDPAAFVVGMMAMNQGRKNIPATLAAFNEFARDKPTARLLLDMEAVGPGGFDIPDVCKQMGYDFKRLIFRVDLEKRGITSLRDRFCLLDVHSVISFREGFGLPLVESMACGIPTMALDWCSGTEIVGGGRGILIPTTGVGRVGTWGGAQDFDPDVPAMVAAFEKLYNEAGYRAALGETGRAWAITNTWDSMCVAVDEAITKAIAHHKSAWKDVHSEAHGLNHHPRLQPTAVPDEVHQQPHGDGDTGGRGDNPDRRLLAGVQPNGDYGRTDAGIPQRAEQGLRGDVQHGGAEGKGGVAVLLEQRHDSPTQLVSTNGQGAG